MSAYSDREHRAPVVPMQPVEWRQVLDGGVIRGHAEGQVWKWAKVPQGVIEGARSTSDALSRMRPLEDALNGLCAFSPKLRGRRKHNLRRYREIHLISISIPEPFRSKGPLGPHQDAWFAGRVVMAKRVFVGVRLLDDGSRTGDQDRSTSEQVVDALDSMTMIADDTMAMTEFEEDRQRVDDLLARCGLSDPTVEDIALLCGWFNRGQMPDVPVTQHSDHIHVFGNDNDVFAAARDGLGNCDAWQGNRALPVTFTAVKFKGVPREATDPLAHWAERLHEHRALCLSIRGLLEPAEVTRKELKARIRTIRNQIAQDAEKGVMDRVEQEEKLAFVEALEARYSAGDAPATLVQTSVVAAFDGRPATPERPGVNLADISKTSVSGGGWELTPLKWRQLLAFREVQPCSLVRANPHMQDLPADFVAASGLGALARVGDHRGGAVVGFTVKDHQAVYMAGDAAAREGAGPFSVILAGTGSGKTVLDLSIARQLAEEPLPRGARHPVTGELFPPGMRRRQVFVSPKQADDLSDAALEAGGTVVTLSDLAQNGLLDPFRYSPEPKGPASSWLGTIAACLVADAQVRPFHTRLTTAMGIAQLEGARCMLEALQIGVRHGQITDDEFRSIVDLGRANALVALALGTSPEGDSITAGEGLTLIQMGSVSLSIHGDGIDGMLSRATYRQIGFASVEAVAGGGRVTFDEAWGILEAAASTLEEFGRTCRSRQVAIQLLTQKPGDALKAGLKSFISRGLVLPIAGDQDECRAALELLGVEPSDDLVERLAARPGSSRSMHARYDRTSGQLISSTRGIFVGLDGEAAEIECVIPAEFLASSRTDLVGRQDRAERKAANVQTAGPATAVWAPPAVS